MDDERIRAEKTVVASGAIAGHCGFMPIRRVNSPVMTIWARR
jgi:hypothetical protein